jgi:hypothetical protein
LRTKILQTLIVQQQCCENYVEFGCKGIVQWDLRSRWLFLFWYNSIWRNSLPSELWYCEPLKQLMYCAVDVWLKSAGITFILWPKAEEWGMQGKGFTRVEKCKSSEMMTVNVKVEGS